MLKKPRWQQKIQKKKKLAKERAARTVEDAIPGIGHAASRDRNTKSAQADQVHWRPPLPLQPDELFIRKLRNPPHKSHPDPYSPRRSPLQLFRALLREASYLPDPASREFAHTQITNRFRRNRNEPSETSNFIETRYGREGGQKIRTVRLLAEGRSELQFLKRANSGAAGPLTKVLEQTYGRRGKRKHELMKDLAPPLETPMNSHDLRLLSEALNDRSSSSKNKKSNDSNDGSRTDETKGAPHTHFPLFSDKLIALLKSQMKQKQDHFSKPLPKSTEPKIPEKNSWGRPMPVGRVKNLSKAWYAETLDRAMPPLPEAEWLHLGELASGKIPWAGPRERRAHRTYSWETDLDEGQMTWSATKTAAQRARDELTRAREAHTLTPRYMRRLWGSVFAQCPVMVWDVEKAKWDVKWGRVDDEKEIVLSVDRPVFDEFWAFAGVNEKGKVLKNEVGQSAA